MPKDLQVHMHVEFIIDCLNKRRERAQPEEPESPPGLMQIFNENPSLRLTRVRETLSLGP